MRNVIIQYDQTPCGSSEYDIRHVNLGKLIDRDGNLCCPRCGKCIFTARVSEAEKVVLSCWSCPTHMAV